MISGEKKKFKAIIEDIKRNNNINLKECELILRIEDHSEDIRGSTLLGIIAVTLQKAGDWDKECLIYTDRIEQGALLFYRKKEMIKK